MMFTEAVVTKRDFFGIQMPMSSKIPRLYSKHYYKKQQTFLLKKNPQNSCIILKQIHQFNNVIFVGKNCSDAMKPLTYSILYADFKKLLYFKLL